MQHVGVVQPLYPVLGQALDRIFRHHVHQLFLLSPPGADNPHRAFPPFPQPVPHQFLVFQGVLDIHHRGNHQRRLVELADELPHNHLGGVVLGAFHKEMVPADELAPADEENLHPGLAGPLGQGNEVHVAAGVGLHLDLLLLRHLVNALYLVTQRRRALKLQFLRRGLHLFLQFPGHRLRVALHEHYHLLDDLGVFLLARQARAGGNAAVNIVFQAGARIPARNRLGAGPIGEQLLNQVHGFANAAGRSKGPEITGAVVGNLPRYVHPGKFFRQVNLKVGVSLVILEAGVEVGLVTLDQRVFQDQRFRLGVRYDELKVGHPGHHPPNLGRVAAGRPEIGAEAVPKHARLAHVQHLVAGVLHQVDARLFGSYPQAMFKLG